MQRSFPWLWILALLAILLLPGPVGRVLIDVLGGLTLFILLLPVVLGGATLVGWQLLRRRLRTCTTCGTSSLGSEVCPACGTPFEASSSADSSFRPRGPDADVDASNVTITVDAVEIDKTRDS